MKNNKLLLLSVVGILILNSCSKDDNTSVNTGLTYSYFPTNVGHELIYDAELITKDEFTGIEETINYQIKEIVESVFIDNQGRNTQRLERYTRESDNDPWVIADVWTSNITPTLVEKKEENVTYIKLVFPVNLNAVWDGNSLNALEQHDYEYTKIDLPGSINGLNFDSTLIVLQTDDDNFISKDHAEERYAAGVGLYYKEQIHILKDYTNPSNPGIKSQRIYTETLKSWSN